MLNHYHLHLKKFWVIIVMVLVCIPAAKAQWILNESFESGSIPSDWTIYDENDDGEAWMAFEHNYAHSGTWLAMVQCYDNDGDDWLVTPQLTISDGDILTFWARAWYGSENMEVLLSVSGNDINDFDYTLDEVEGLGSSYQEFTYDLSEYAGQQVYLAIRWEQDTYALIVDDIKVGKPQPKDAGMISIENPGEFHASGSEIVPAGTVKNFSPEAITTDFPVGCLITNQENTVVYNETTTFTGGLAGGETGIVEFPSWSADTPGTFSITMFTDLPDDGDSSNDTIISSTDIVLHYGTGGPDAMSYRWTDSNEPNGPQYNWIDISTTGSSAIMEGVNSFAGDDNFSEPINIGFDFPFYGIDRTYFYADVNGEILLTQNQWYKPFPDDGWDNDGNPFNYHTAIPGYTEMPALISVFWDDLEAEEGTGDVYYQTFGTTPDRYCVIQWDNLKFHSGTGGDQTLAFQVILNENGDILMQYKNVDNGQSGSSIPHVLGQSATVAIQNDYANAGLSYLREVVENNQYIGPEPPGNILHNEMAIKFYIGEDNEVPLITHDRLWNTFNNYAEITATFTDASGIATDTLYYNTGGEWITLAHTSFEEPNIYHYDLNDLPLGTTVEYYFAVTDGSANQNRLVYSQSGGEDLYFKILPTEDVRVLLAMPGNIPGFQDYNNTEFPKYTTALDALGIDYDVYNWAAFDTYTIPDSYDIIIAYSNSTRITDIHDTLSKALINFMDGGTIAHPKNVFMASDNMPSAAYGLPNGRYLKKFFTAYLRGGYSVQPNPPYYGGPNGIAGPDSLGYYYGSMKGLANSPVGTEDVEIPVYANDPDVIYNRECPEWYADEVSNPEISSWGSFTFEDGPFNGDAYSKGNGCGIWLNNLIYKSFFMSFDISQFTNDADIQTLMSQVMEWFTPATYTINLTADPPEGGNTSGGGQYVEGAEATVTAGPSTGYDFINWTENGNPVSSDPEYSFTVSASRELVAHFELQSFEISATADPQTGGTITGTGTYNYNETATLNATASTGYDFINWTENGNPVSSDPEYSFTVSANRELVAHFELQSFEISATADPQGGGIITGTGTYNYNETATLTATPEDNFEFIDWTENGTVVSTDDVYSFTVTTGRALVANFQVIQSLPENEVLQNIRLYPNPSQGMLTIDMQPFLGKKAAIAIRSYSGKEVFSQEVFVTGTKKMIDVTALRPGIYFVSVQSDGYLYSGKLVIL